MLPSDSADDAARQLADSLAHLIRSAIAAGSAAQPAAPAPPKEPTSRLLCDREEAAEMLSVCARTVDALAKRGEISTVRIGRAVRFPVSELQSWIDRNKTAALEPAAGV